MRDEGAFELADVGADVGGDEEGDVGGENGVFELCLLLKDGDLGLEVRRLDVGDEAPLEAGAEAVFEVRQLLRRPVRRDDDLLHRLVERIEGVEELFLGALFAGEELDVVDQEDVDVAELVAEAGHLVVADGVDHLVGEFFTGDVGDGGVRLAAFYVVADGVHEVGLAHADAAVEEEGVVGAGGSFGDGLCGGHGELVSGADDKGVELVLGIELGGGAPVEAGLLGSGAGCGGGMAAVQGVEGAGARGVGAVAGQRCEAAILADTGSGGLGRGLKGDGVDIEREVFDRLLDEISVAVADVGEILGGDADEEGSIVEASVARWLEPGLKGLPADLLFECRQDANPRIGVLTENGGC